ncbi:hypothetical protein M0804_011623 [Polistes exclamans]|nr:hypothetical protein M0804_011623 [Polistes exclamans]
MKRNTNTYMYTNTNTNRKHAHEQGQEQEHEQEHEHEQECGIGKSKASAERLMCLSSWNWYMVKGIPVKGTKETSKLETLANNPFARKCVSYMKRRPTTDTLRTHKPKDVFLTGSLQLSATP